MANTPKIRFKGFTDPWEQRKLGELATKVTQKNGDMAVTETFTNSAEFGIVSQLDFFDHDIAKAESIGGYFVVQSEDFVYNPRISVTAPVGPINMNRLGRAGVMSPLYTVFRSGDGIDNVFLEHYFKTASWHDFMQLNGNSGARSDRFSISDSVFFEMPVSCPSMAEQVAIADTLEGLDNLITLHQRKYDKLVVLKKSLLDKMFPKDGETVPEVRFAGFTDPWEQRKLRELCDKFCDGDWIESKDQSEFGMRLVQTGNIGTAEFLDKRDRAKWVSEDTFERLKCTEIFPGDILISRLPEPAGRACILPDLQERMITAVDCTVVRTSDECDSFYLVQFLSSEGYFKKIEQLLGGGTRQRVTRSALGSFDIPLPSIDEQRQIGTVLSSFDNLITLHQRKLDLLKNVKSSLLDKMFV